MPDPTQTIRGAEGPGPVRLGALDRLAALVGEREYGGKNWGPIVQRVAGPFLSPPRLASYAPGGARAGGLQWCALAVCWAILDELEARPQRELAGQWKRIASASCGTLWGNLDSLGWAWRRGAALPAALCPVDAGAPGIPGPGDLVFYGDFRDNRPNLRHVDFYAEVREGGRWSSIGGNSGPKADAVARVDRVNSSEVYGYARVPW